MDAKSTTVGVLVGLTLMSAGMTLTDTDVKKIESLKQDLASTTEALKEASVITAKSVKTETGDLVIPSLGNGIVQSITIKGYKCVKQ